MTATQVMKRCFATFWSRFPHEALDLCDVVTICLRHFAIRFRMQLRQVFAAMAGLVHRHGDNEANDSHRFFWVCLLAVLFSNFLASWTAELRFSVILCSSRKSESTFMSFIGFGPINYLAKLVFQRVGFLTQQYQGLETGRVGQRGVQLWAIREG